MGYREQFIWQKALDLSVRCYKLTEYFPKSEIYGITSQIRRSSVSIASNIATGYGSKSRRGYVHFLHIALGSLCELDTQLIIALRVGMTQPHYIKSVLEDVDQMQKLLKSTINTLIKKEKQSPSAVSPGARSQTSPLRGFSPVVGTDD